MRVALISDLHGNDLALEAVLADVRRRGVEQIACLGDTATLGPHPREVLARLRDLSCPCIVGNHDAFLHDPDLVRSYNEAPVITEAVLWCRDRLTAEELDFVGTFVATWELPLDGAGRLVLCHGTPRSHMEDLLSTTPPEAVDAMLAGCEATVIAAGHTHIQMLRQHRGILLVNPGSVGMPFEEYVFGKVPKLLPYAEWACVEAERGRVSVSLHRVELDRAALRASVAGSSNPLASWLSSQYA
ncbi:MAG: metallophosphoesterase family protein [Myxococcales bacterium]|jgi:putative phosphoesterase|nr:metallophosphoesterase family protein [Myxococcales bacterium]